MLNARKDGSCQANSKSEGTDRKNERISTHGDAHENIIQG